jgi:spermidine synthase
MPFLTSVLVLGLFFLSGATALVYEVAWSKYLALIFGSTVQAQTVVLAVFMGGLALGNHLFGRLADRLRQPLAAYGYLEGCIGLYAFFFPQIYRAADALFIAIGAPLLGNGAALLLLKGGIAVALLLGPTLLMGGTLPLMAAWLQRNSNEYGRGTARFYSTNSLGAVTGAGLAGFYLVRSWGLPATLQLGAVANIAIAIVAVGLSRRLADEAPAEKPAAPATPVSAEQPRLSLLSSGMLLVMFTGAVSMGLEVLAARCLSLIFGASLQAFALVLMAFILGIGIGASIVASPRWRNLRRDAVAVALILVAATLVLIFVWQIEWCVEAYRWIKTGVAASTVGYLFYQLMIAGFALVILGVPAGLLGAVLPLCLRAAAGPDGRYGSRVGALLTWNTIGAVVGVLLTGFVLMPVLGMRGAFALLALMLASAAAVAAFGQGLKKLSVAAAAVAALVIGVWATSGDSWRLVLSSGIFRIRETEYDPGRMARRVEVTKLLYYRDAPDATVSVDSNRERNDEVTLHINGKPDASSKGDLSTQMLLGHVPMALRPQAKRVFVLGLGSGITGGSLLNHPIEELVVAENCAPVIAAAAYFAPWNNGVLTNARARIVREDARTVLKLDRRPYDIIISEPSNPWTAGVGSVFSVEFYQLCASRLVEGGIMAQWFHVYEMHDGIVDLVLNSFGRVFPHFEIWDTGSGDIVLTGATQPFRSDASVYAGIFAHAPVREQLALIGITDAPSLWLRQFASQQTAFAIPGSPAFQSDEFPVLEYAAPRAFFVGRTAERVFQFDERTWQAALSPAAKQAALRQFDLAAAQLVFTNGGSANPFLRRKLAEQAGDATGQPTALTTIFDRPSAPKPLPAGASEPLARLHGIETRLAGPQWAEAADVIERELDAFARQPDGAKVDWSPPRFAALAIRAALARGDHPRVARLIEKALRLEPANEEFAYFQRLADVWRAAARP